MKNKIELLIERIKQLPRPEIEESARIYERRSSETPNARNDVAGKIAIALRLFLDGLKT